MPYIFISFFLTFSVGLMAQVKLIAHRGASYIAPENTLASVRLAYELGADAAEVDVYLSADHYVMVNHDKTTRRTSAGQYNYNIAKTDAATLNQVDVGTWKDPKYACETLPYLRDVLALVPQGKQLVVEIKCGPEIIPALTKVINESAKIEQCLFISFSWKTICAVHTAFPDNECYYLKMMKPGLKSKMKKAAAEGLSGVNLYHKIIDKKISAYAESLGLDLFCWTVDEPDDFRRMEQLGVVGLTSNRPSLFIQK